MIKKFYLQLYNYLNDWRCRDIKKYFEELPLKTCSNKVHLKAAMRWLCRAQDATPDDGVSALYSLSTKKWIPSYPETTGYIISTFLQYAKYSHDNAYKKRAIKMGDWEIAIQLPEGGCLGGNVTNTRPRVFNTGQIMLGWCALYQSTREQKYLNAAVRAADWLILNQDKDGKWTNYTYQGPKTYHARVAWPLLKIYKLTQKIEYKKAAEANLSWTLNRQNKAGWFSDTSLSSPNKPWTHLIAYTLRGILESYLITGQKELLDSVLKAACAIVNSSKERRQKPRKIIGNFLPGSFDKNWQSTDNYSCLTGSAQIAILLFKLYNITKEKKFYNTASDLTQQLKQIQILDKNAVSGIRGGISGSFPINGAYCSYSMLNWAAKFFADALMLEERLI